MGEGKPFLEILASALNEDYRFPILEVFAFLYTIGTFVWAGIGGVEWRHLYFGEGKAFGLVNTLTGLPTFILMILILKNIAYGLGNELHKGVIQTFLSYPLKRRWLLTAKLLSSLGVSLLLFSGIQFFALFMLAPEIVSAYLSTVILTFVAVLSYPLFVASLVLLLTLFMRKGSTALIVGIFIYFVSGMFPYLGAFTAAGASFDLLLKAFAIINPNLVLQLHYRPNPELWIPSFNESLLYLGASYVLVISILLASYLYFEKRLEI